MTHNGFEAVLNGQPASLTDKSGHAQVGKRGNAQDPEEAEDNQGSPVVSAPSLLTTKTIDESARAFWKVHENGATNDNGVFAEGFEPAADLTEQQPVTRAQQGAGLDQTGVRQQDSANGGGLARVDIIATASGSSTEISGPEQPGSPIPPAPGDQRFRPEQMIEAGHYRPVATNPQAEMTAETEPLDPGKALAAQVRSAGAGASPPQDAGRISALRRESVGLALLPTDTNKPDIASAAQQPSHEGASTSPDISGELAELA
ncbi:MAG: hypothetical protein ACK5JT_16540, partial [Hyphomicrobiaceae bacterium]